MTVSSQTVQRTTLPGIAFRAFYCLSAATFIWMELGLPPGISLSSLGRSLSAKGWLLQAVTIALLATLAYRAFRIARGELRPEVGLHSAPTNAGRALGIIWMVCGPLAFFAALLLMSRTDVPDLEESVRRSITQRGLVVASFLGIKGIILYELSRLIDLERKYRGSTAPVVQTESGLVILIACAALFAYFTSFSSFFLQYARGERPMVDVWMPILNLAPLIIIVLLRVLTLLPNLASTPHFSEGRLGRLRSAAIAVSSMVLLSSVFRLLQEGGVLPQYGLSALFYLLGPFYALAPSLLVGLDFSRLLGLEKLESRAQHS